MKNLIWGLLKKPQLKQRLLHKKNVFQKPQLWSWGFLKTCLSKGFFQKTSTLVDILKETKLRFFPWFCITLHKIQFLWVVVCWKKSFFCQKTYFNEQPSDVRLMWAITFSHKQWKTRKIWRRWIFYCRRPFLNDGTGTGPGPCWFVERLPLRPKLRCSFARQIYNYGRTFSEP